MIGKGLAAPIERDEQATYEDFGITENVDVQRYLLEFPLHHGRHRSPPDISLRGARNSARYRR